MTEPTADDERLAAVCIEAVDLVRRGRHPEAIELLQGNVPDGRSLFGVACGLATLVLGDTPPCGPVITEALPGAFGGDPAAVDTAAFIAAVGNGDTDGAIQVLFASNLVAGRMLGHMLHLAACLAVERLDVRESEADEG